MKYYKDQTFQSTCDLIYDITPNSKDNLTLKDVNLIRFTTLQFLFAVIPRLMIISTIMIIILQVETIIIERTEPNIKKEIENLELIKQELIEILRY
jgi:hypothetical protein